MSIICTKFVPYEKNSLLGFADFFLEKWGVDIKGCTYHDKQGARWVSLPSKDSPPGSDVKYYPIIRFRERKHQDAFSDAAKKAIEKYIKENQQTTQNTDNFDDFAQGCPF